MKKIFSFVAFSVLLFSCSESSQNQEPVDEIVQEEVATVPDYGLQGKTIAQQTFKVMSGKLQSAMSESGVEGAIVYCNASAFKIADSLSGHYNADIRRATPKPRNPNNGLTEAELAVYNIWAEKLESGQELKPTTMEEEGKVHFYAPIQVKPLCLSCHGEVGKTLVKKDYEVISALYPADKAVGYKEGDLRGLWHITFKL